MAKKAGGNGAKPSVWFNGLWGMNAPTATTMNTEASSGLDGRLRKNGTRRVRMTNTMSVCVASDSTNQPERNSGALASNTQSITAKVAKSNTELMGPKRI